MPLRLVFQFPLRPLTSRSIRKILSNSSTPTFFLYLCPTVPYVSSNEDIHGFFILAKLSTLLRERPLFLTARSVASLYNQEPIPRFCFFFISIYIILYFLNKIKSFDFILFQVYQFTTFTRALVSIYQGCSYPLALCELLPSLPPSICSTDWTKGIDRLTNLPERR